MEVDVDACQDRLTYTAAEDEPLSEAVISALRAAADETPSSEGGADLQNVGVLTPLFETIDPDALNALFSSTENGTTRTGTVTFTHDGYEVTVSATGEIAVSSP